MEIMPGLLKENKSQLIEKEVIEISETLMNYNSLNQT